MNEITENTCDPKNVFAQSDADAKQKYKTYKSKDPFPQIAPALLNSADIMDYVAATGMIYPFYPELDKDDRDVKYWKTASYEIRLLGKCVYWDEKGKKVVDEISEGNEFILRRNSIAFVTLEPRFQIPDYIALRFNLKITHIYRGILLGTGPLVDPGFNGKISIPLHNLTTNDYIFRGGEGLIWMEFTKLSDNNTWDKENRPIQRLGKLRRFPEGKSLSDVEDFLRKAYPGPIRSSIPEAIYEARNVVETTEKLLRRVRTIGIMAVIGFLIAFAGLVWQLESLIHDSNSYLRDASKEFKIVKEGEQKDIENLKKDFENLRKSIEQMKNSQNKNPGINR